MSEHINSEGERLTIERRMMNGVTPVYCLVIWDDAPPHGKGIPAPMLFDKGTRDFIKSEIERIENDDAVKEQMET